MSDIVQRLRDGLEEGAIDLADIMDAADEIQRLRLTPEEIAALSWFTGGRGPVCPQHLSTIRGIIEKHSPQPAETALDRLPTFLDIPHPKEQSCR